MFIEFQIFNEDQINQQKKKIEIFLIIIKIL